MSETTASTVIGALIAGLVLYVRARAFEGTLGTDDDTGHAMGSTSPHSHPNGFPTCSQPAETSPPAPPTNPLSLAWTSSSADSPPWRPTTRPTADQPLGPGVGTSGRTGATPTSESWLAPWFGSHG